MKSIIFAKRNIKEIFRDPISVFFCILFPIFILVIFQQFNIPSEVYNVQNFAPGIIIFGFSFITLFTGTLVSKDRSTSFLTRLYSSPMKMKDYLLGYIFALVPVALMQSTLFIVVSLFYGMEFNFNLILTILVSLPISALFICLGILFGSIFTDKQAPALSSIIIQLVAFTSGLWFDIEQLGGVIKTISSVLPFKYCVDILRALFNKTDILISDISILSGYIVLVAILSILIFKKRTKED